MSKVATEISISIEDFCAIVERGIATHNTQRRISLHQKVLDVSINHNNVFPVTISLSGVGNDFGRNRNVEENGMDG